MYGFLGKMMGLAMRTRELLQLDLPSVLWKPLVGADITEHDIESMDRTAFNILDQVKMLEGKVASGEIKTDEFADLLGLQFEAQGSDGLLHPLVDNGHHIPVQWARRVRQFSSHCTYLAVVLICLMIVFGYDNSGNLCDCSSNSVVKNLLCKQMQFEQV
jgi:hypothetical protein